MEINETSSINTNTAASSIVNLFFNEINKQDVTGVLDVQNSLIEQLDKTNEKLDGINKLSAKRYLDATREFSNHVHTLTKMKTDLDLIFTRIKSLKTRLNSKYPEAYTTVMEINANHNNSLHDDDFDSNLNTTIKSACNTSLVKSKTIDVSQLSSSIRDTYGLVQANPPIVEQSPNSFDAVRRFVFEKSSGGHDLTAMFKTARDELRKLNPSFLGGNHQNRPTSNED